MKALIQIVKQASVTIDEKEISKINKGFLVFLGYSKNDTKEICDKVINKLTKLRIFSDADGKTNLSLADVDGEILAVSQFTLYANCKKGNRPSFIEGARGNTGKELYDYSIHKLKELGFKVQTGIFGADMKVALINDGPFTIWLDSKEL